MSSRIFSIVEVDANDGGSYAIINGQWWKLQYDPGSSGNDSQEIGIADSGHDAGDYVWPVETRKMSDVSIESYRLKVSMAYKGDTDFIERDIANHILLEERNELLEFQRLD